MSVLDADVTKMTMNDLKRQVDQEDLPGLVKYLIIADEACRRVDEEKSMTEEQLYKEFEDAIEIGYMNTKKSLAN